MTETETSPQATEGAAEEKKPGVGDLAKQLLREGKSNKEVLDAVKEAFPDAKTSMSSVNWYRNNLRSLGEEVKTAREISAAGKEDEKASKKAAKDAEKAEKKAKRETEKAEKKAQKAEEAAAKKAAKEAEKAKDTAGASSETQTASMLE